VGRLAPCWPVSPLLTIRQFDDTISIVPDTPLSGRSSRDTLAVAGGLSAPPVPRRPAPPSTSERTSTMKHDDLKALARSRRESALADLRDGRVRRASRIESAQRYRRRPKHQ
jgi:hypothetical protein